MKNMKEHWVTVVLYALFSVFFLVCSVVSAGTYSAVVRTQRDVVLIHPTSSVSILPNGSLELDFSIELSNPSRYVLHTQTMSWYATLENGTTGSGIITLGTAYTGPTSWQRVLPRSESNFSFSSVVSDPAIIASLNGYINYSAASGRTYTITTLPYNHQFSFIGTIGEFKNDYLREDYLNELVTVEVTYSSGAMP
ncbi:MAG: hypothetical protein NTY62_03455 [Euryarchaeota archaeon]|nr:hypothetical protein [Euryarchaeota archaeon]